MYKRINVYLAYAVTALIFTFFVLPAPSLADCQFQINAGAQAWHVMWGPNAGDEREMVMPGGAGINKLDNDRWAFAQTGVFAGLCDELDPTPLRDLREGQKHTFNVADADVGTCTVTDTGGQTRNLANHGATFIRTRAPDYWIDNGEWCHFIVHHWGYE